MKTFVSKIWVAKEKPEMSTISVASEITTDTTFDEMVDEFIETFIIGQEPGKTNMVSMPFANVHILVSYTNYSTEEMASIFAHKDAYTRYVAETMLKISESMVYVNKTIADFINQKYS